MNRRICRHQWLLGYQLRDICSHNAVGHTFYFQIGIDSYLQETRELVVNTVLAQLFNCIFWEIRNIQTCLRVMAVFFFGGSVVS